MDRLLEVQRIDQRRQVVGIGVHIIAIPRLIRPPMAAAVVRDAAVPPRSQKHHLVFPRVRAQGPAMAEDNRLSLPPVLVIEVNVA